MISRGCSLRHSDTVMKLHDHQSLELSLWHEDAFSRPSGFLSSLSTDHTNQRLFRSLKDRASLSKSPQSGGQAVMQGQSKPAGFQSALFKSTIQGALCSLTHWWNYTKEHSDGRGGIIILCRTERKKERNHIHISTKHEAGSFLCTALIIHHFRWFISLHFYPLLLFAFFSYWLTVPPLHQQDHHSLHNNRLSHFHHSVMFRPAGVVLWDRWTMLHCCILCCQGVARWSLQCIE